MPTAFRKSSLDNPEPCIWRLLNCAIPRHFTKHVEDINAIFGQQQIENIHYTISLIDKQPKQDKLDQLVKQNVTKCVNWCIEHSIAYNNLVTANVFEQGNLGYCGVPNRNPPIGTFEQGNLGSCVVPNRTPTTNWSAPEYRGLYNYCC